jgi:chromosome segregation ATPase
VAAQQALSEEKTTRSAAVEALAEAKHTLIDLVADEAKLSQALKTTKAAYSTTHDNLASRSKDLNDAMIREQEANKLWEQAEAKLADAEKRLDVAEGEKKDQGMLLETARQALSKCEDSSILMISTEVANAMTLLKSYLPNLDVELLHKDFVIDEAECKALTSGAYDAAHEFILSYDFSSFAEFEDNDNPRNM